MPGSQIDMLYFSAVGTFSSETSFCREVGKVAANTGVYLFEMLFAHPSESLQ